VQLAIAPHDAPVKEHPEDLLSIRPGMHCVVARADDVDAWLCVQAVEVDGHRIHGPIVYDVRQMELWPADEPALTWCTFGREAVWDLHDLDWHVGR
jgi:hypothetical protein